MGAVDTTYTFTATDTITSTKMNNIIDQTTITSDAIIGTTLEVASGKIKVRAAGITSNEIATGAVTSNAIATGAVTSNAIADGTIVNNDINASAEISPSKLGSGALPAGATVTTANIVDASITAPKLNGAQTGTAPIFGARAYGAFNGTATSPITPIKAGNIASVTRNSTGAYTVVMTTAMPDANYCVIANAYHTIGVSGGNSVSVSITNSTTFNLTVINHTGLLYNPIYLGFSVFA